MNDEDYTIISADFHRNGVGGQGFYLGLVEVDGERYLTMDFAGDEDSDPEGFDKTRFGVAKIAELAAGNLGSFPIVHPESGEQLSDGGNGFKYEYFSHLRRPVRDWAHASSQKRHEQLVQRVKEIQTRRRSI